MKQAAQHLHPDYVNLVYAFQGSSPKWFRNLSAAIMNQVFVALGQANIKNRQSTECWIFSNDAGYIFSFVNICSLLQIDPEVIRGKIRSGY